MMEPINKVNAHVHHAAVTLKEKQQQLNVVVNENSNTASGQTNSFVMEKNTKSHLKNTVVIPKKNCQFLFKLPQTENVEQTIVDNTNVPSRLLRMILSSERLGRIVLETFYTKNKCDDLMKRTIVSEVVKYFIKRDAKMTKPLYTLLAEDICKMCPDELKETFFCSDEKGKFKGKLYYSYRYWKNNPSFIKLLNEKKEVSNENGVNKNTNLLKVYVPSLNKTNEQKEEEEVNKKKAEELNKKKAEELNKKKAEQEQEQANKKKTEELNKKKAEEEQEKANKKKAEEEQENANKKKAEEEQEKANKKNKEKNVEQHYNEEIEVKIEEDINYNEEKEKEEEVHVQNSNKMQVINKQKEKKKAEEEEVNKRKEKDNEQPHNEEVVVKIEDEQNYDVEMEEEQEEKEKEEVSNVEAVFQKMKKFKVLVQNINKTYFINQQKEKTIAEKEQMEEHVNKKRKLDNEEQNYDEEEEEEEENDDVKDDEDYEDEDDEDDEYEDVYVSEKELEKEKRELLRNGKVENIMKDKEMEEENITVKLILSLTRNGQKFLNHYKLKSEFIENGRKILIDEIINYYIKNNVNLTKELCHLLMKEIIKMFPNETKNAYFELNEKDNFVDKLYNIYEQTIGKLKQKSYLKIQKILSTTNEGKKFLEDYAKFLNDNEKSKIDENIRKFLVKEIVCYYIKNETKISPAVFSALATEIVSMFPTESKESYFRTDANGRLRGRLVSANYHYNRKLKMETPVDKDQTMKVHTRASVTNKLSESPPTPSNIKEPVVTKEKQLENHFTVHEILSFTVTGEKFLQNSLGKRIDEDDIKFLVKEIVCFYIKLKIKISPASYDSLATEIVSMYPKESKDKYFRIDSQGRLRGSLYYAHYRYQKKGIKLAVATSENEKHFTVREILSKTAEGQKFLEDYGTKTNIDENGIRFLVKEVVCYYIRLKIKISAASYNSLATEIVSMFPTESKDTYFRLDTKGRLRGRLYNSHYRYEKKGIDVKPTVEKHLTVKEILSSTTQGQKFLSKCTVKGELDEFERKYLITEIASYYLKHKMELPYDLTVLLTEEIVSLFPKELKNNYYNVDKHGRRRSRIYGIYYRLSKQTIEIDKSVVTEKHFTVKEILNSTTKGQKFLNDYRDNPTMDIESRKFLMTEIANYYTAHNSMLSLKLSLLLVKEITQIFPNECKDNYFKVDKQGKLRGKLYDYYYKAKQSIINKTTNPSEFSVLH